jgi:sterol desaturase/sphingolipid hydroxylase (fatty acid hydroxylase superfamily)
MLALTFGMCLFVLALELAWPQGEASSNASRRFAALACTITIPLFTLAGVIALDRPPLLTAGTIGTVAAVVLSLFAYDFCIYWLHRAQHRFPLLWRFHAVHHSPEELGVPAGYHHVSEPFLRAAVCSIPTGLLVGAPALAVVVIFGTFHGVYLHSRTRLGLGRFAWIITDNRVHRIHHSRDPAHYNRNFGNLTLLWDRLFGTAYFPRPGEWPKVGLDDYPEASTVRELFVGLKQRADGGTVSVTQGGVVNSLGL